MEVNSKIMVARDWGQWGKQARKGPVNGCDKKNLLCSLAQQGEHN
jgi:hypothetical protein